ncbi:TrbC/VirB2 family protein [Massilia soli]|uniref:TrbC/VirB2 family protein n=1 Tax=Massilia soli TaxID=2792854 RepID=A0ABS7SN92_9BURK|nr:TrbC/VirB2 family protein [Massilia soli]MBZ2207152.1 TrbC/VirB2 family protein [Massilia soli]
MSRTTAAKPTTAHRADPFRLGLALTFVIVFCCSAEPAFAQSNPVQNMLNGVIGFLNSGVMRSLAILAVIAAGIAAYLGRITWGTGGMLMGGLILTFGAASLVDQFSGFVS